MEPIATLRQATAAEECTSLASWTGRKVSCDARAFSYFSSMAMRSSIFLMMLKMRESESFSSFMLLKLISSFFSLTSMLRIIQMHRFLNNPLRFCLRRLARPAPYLCFSTGEADLLALKEAFQRGQDMVVFNGLIQQSNNSLDNINYFRIFKILEDNHSPIKHYEDFFHQVNSTVNKKSDNIRMLLAKVKARIAKKHEENKSYYDAIDQVEQALAVLEDSLVPPLLLYYQLYRYYGHMQNAVGNKKEALEALSESVDMIERYLEHSDDQVTSNENCRSQAKAYNALVDLDPQRADQWLKKANDSWEDYEGNRFELEEYADTVIHNARKEYRQGRDKGEGYVMYNLYQFKKQALKERLSQLRSEFQK